MQNKKNSSIKNKRSKSSSTKKETGKLKKSTRKNTLKRNKKLILLVLLIVVSIISLFICYLVVKDKDTKNTDREYTPISRKVILIAEDVVKSSKPTPPASARLYAYVASSYYDQLKATMDLDRSKEDKTLSSILVSTELIKEIAPSQSEFVDKETKDLISELYPKNKESIEQLKTRLSNLFTSNLDKYKSRQANDGHDLVFDGVIPTGEGKWVRVNGAGPLEPRAGEWMRWRIKDQISVPPPPIVGSEEDLTEISKVTFASASRDIEWVNKINFWGGAPGTEAPSGIWQNIAYDNIKEKFSNLSTENQELINSYTQMVLAQTLADAFIECWKVKYAYWTARPNMRNSSIVTAMDNPAFPSYVSGHSTISKAAADVLGYIYPDLKNKFENMAIEARDSRLYGGIHFEIDNIEGFNLGTKVADQIKSGDIIQNLDSNYNQIKD